jgi:hypothetical protein
MSTVRVRIFFPSKIVAVMPHTGKFGLSPWLFSGIKQGKEGPATMTVNKK